MVHDPADRFEVAFDDQRAVANAGLLLPVTLGRRLGLEALIDEAVVLGDRPGTSRPGRKVLSLAHAMLLGADCIDDCEILRTGRTEAVLGHRPMAPSTLGTFLRSFSFGHVRQLDRVLAEALRRAWRAGAGPGDQRLVIDIDSFIGEVHGPGKQGAGYGYTHRLGYHPLLATRADSNEVLHVRLRKGQANTQRGALRFVDELLARVRRTGATGEILIRADSGFWNKKVIARLRAKRCRYSIGVTNHRIVSEAIARIPITPGSRSPTTPTPASASWPRPRSARTGWSSAASTCTPKTTKPSSSPTGGTSRSSPTAPSQSTSSTPSTVSMPRSSWSSAT